MSKDNGASATEQLQAGPCIICGLRNYSLSFGGPTICPSCDCGNTGQEKVRRQAERIMELEKQLSAASETRTPTFENLQDAPRTLRNVFTVQHEGKRADVVFASFASCIEREANALRHDMKRGMANHNADLNAAPSATRAISGQSGPYYKPEAAPEPTAPPDPLRIAAEEVVAAFADSDYEVSRKQNNAIAKLAGLVGPKEVPW